jgi:hypothetical protein
MSAPREKRLPRRPTADPLSAPIAFGPELSSARSWVIANGGKDILTSDGSPHTDDPRVREASIKSVTSKSRNLIPSFLCEEIKVDTWHGSTRHTNSNP